MLFHSHKFRSLYIHMVASSEKVCCAIAKNVDMYVKVTVLQIVLFYKACV